MATIAKRVVPMEEARTGQMRACLAGYETALQRCSEQITDDEEAFWRVGGGVDFEE